VLFLRGKARCFLAGFDSRVVLTGPCYGELFWLCGNATGSFFFVGRMADFDFPWGGGGTREDIMWRSHFLLHARADVFRFL